MLIQGEGGRENAAESWGKKIIALWLIIYLNSTLSQPCRYGTELIGLVALMAQRVLVFNVKHWVRNRFFFRCHFPPADDGSKTQSGWCKKGCFWCAQSWYAATAAVRLPVIMETSFARVAGTTTPFFSLNFQIFSSSDGPDLSHVHPSSGKLYIRPFRIGTICLECYSNCHEISTIFSPFRESAPPQSPRPRWPQTLLLNIPFFIFFSFLGGWTSKGAISHQKLIKMTWQLLC